MVGNGNGSVLNTINRVPWTPIITVVGWITLGLVFYATTKQQLETHQMQITEIIRNRERTAEQVNNRIDRVSLELRNFQERVDRLDTPLAKKVEGNSQLLTVFNDRVNSALANAQTVQATNTARFEQFQKQLDLLEKRNDQLLQALDAQYNALNEHLRAHGGTSLPRR